MGYSGSGIHYWAKSLRQKHEYARLRSKESDSTGIMKALLGEGVVIVPDFIDGTLIQLFKRAIPPIEKCQLSPEGTRTRFYLHADGIEPLAPFFRNQLITDTMRKVLGPTATMFRAVVQYRVDLGNTGAFEHFYHMDSWRPRYKAFLYLTDVDHGNGPFTYTPRTHYGMWRYRYERDIAQIFSPGPHGLINDEESAYVGCLWPHEYTRVCKHLGTGPKVVTGKAGTLILFDARGLHRIPPLEHAPRIILSSYWIREGQHS
jgi:hypothetical protein